MKNPKFFNTLKIQIELIILNDTQLQLYMQPNLC